MIHKHFAELMEDIGNDPDHAPMLTPLPNGGHLIRVPGVKVAGWNRPTADVLFVAPPGYPAAQPDCFWVEPAGFRLADGTTPQASNDGNPIPGDFDGARRTTWFSWHVQGWNPNHASLTMFFRVIMSRLAPPR